MKVIVLMTMPLKSGAKQHASLSILHTCKAAVTNRDILGIITSVVHAPLARFPKVGEDESKVLQLYLTFVRNMMAIPDADDGDKATANFHLSNLNVRSCFCNACCVLCCVQNCATPILNLSFNLQITLLHCDCGNQSQPSYDEV